MDGSIALPQGKTIAFVTPELFIPTEGGQPKFYTYSGGLGVLAGAMGRGAKKLNKDLVIFSFLPRFGYYEQGVEQDVNGKWRMSVRFEHHNYDSTLEFGDLVTIPIAKSPVHLKSGRLDGNPFQMTDCYLLDADIDRNDWLSRVNTHYLYGGPEQTGGNWERKIAQCIVLGFGSVADAKKRSLNIDLWHGNDCHSVFVPIALLRDALASGLSLVQAIDQVIQKWVFTTHTPVQAGNWMASLDDIVRLAGDHILTREVLGTVGHDAGNPGAFNFAAACMRLAGRINTVSKKHLDTALKMWAWDSEIAGKMVAITNGADTDYWQGSVFRDARSARDLQLAKRDGNKRLLEHIKATTGKDWEDYRPTIVVDRRFAGYKRMDLLPRFQFDWFRAQLDAGRFQYIISGKPYPDDWEQVRAWERLYNLSKEIPNLAVLPGYDMEMSRIHKQGAHLWLNNPRVPNEACGTSGMGAAMNGCINISTADGWMAEADPKNFFKFGMDFPGPSLHEQDSYDARDLVTVLDIALDEYFHDQIAWYERAFQAKREAEAHFSDLRMVEEYDEKLWNPETYENLLLLETPGNVVALR